MFTSTFTGQRSIVLLATAWRWEEVLPQLFDRCLWTLIVLTPFAWGGRGDGARAVYAVVAVATFVAWLADHWAGRRLTPVFGRLLTIPVLAACWLAVQVMPLPESVISLLSPGVRQYLPLWHGDGSFVAMGLGHWTTLSLHPTATQVSLAVLLCHTITLFVLLQRIRSLADVELVLKWVAQAAIAMAVFGLLQYFTADGLFFWVFEHPFRQSDDFVCGSFVNRNHCASFLAMGAAAVCCQLVVRQSDPKPVGRKSSLHARDYRTALWAGGLAIVLLAILMTASRGGVLAAMAGAAVMTGMYWKQKLWGHKQVGHLLVSLVLLASGLAVYGEDRLTQRLEHLTDGSVETLDRLGARRAIWAANLRAISTYWTTGTGAGTHQDVYPLFMAEYFPKVFTHAENGYLQIATELGLPGTLLLLATLAWLTRRTVAAWQSQKSRMQSACLGAVVSGLVVSLLHSCYDFVWYIPATMTIALVLVTSLRRLARGDEPTTFRYAQGRRLPYELAIGAAAAVSFIGVVLIPPALASSAWNRYQSASARLDFSQRTVYGNLASSGDPSKLNDCSGLLELEINALRDVLDANPRSSAAHLRLARSYLQWFDARSESRDNRMTLGHLQGAVITNGFTSAEAVTDWLAVAIGDDLRLLQSARRHAAEAVRLAPLDSLAYVCLANLAFLENRVGPASHPLLEQAAVLGPQDGTLLFEIGKQYLVAGELASAIEYWKRCYQHDGRHRLLVIAALAGRIPATDFLQTFAPDWKTLRSVWQRYLAAGELSDAEVLLAYANQQVENYTPGPQGVAPAYVWMWLGEMNGDVGRTDEQIACVERALQEQPSLYPVRKAYATALLKAERYAEAEPHLRWCVARDPANSGLRTCLHRAAALRYSQRRTQTASPTVSDTLR